MEGEFETSLQPEAPAEVPMAGAATEEQCSLLGRLWQEGFGHLRMIDLLLPREGETVQLNG
jgi:hypothetical protein